MSPSLYLFYGNDSAAIDEALLGLQTRLGDAASAAMNLTRLSGPPLSLEEMRTAAFSMPFLAEKRLVFVEGTSKAFSKKEDRESLFALLEQIPESTGLVLIENSLLGEDDKRKKKPHWLKVFFENIGEQAFSKRFALPEGRAMGPYLQDKAKQMGGELEGPAAAALAELLGSDTQAAIHEIEKLLAFVNYARAITEQDVQQCALEIGEHGDYFGLLDALAAGPGPRALTLLRKLQTERDSLGLFFNLVGQFRLLLQAREIVDSGGGKEQIAKALGIHPYRAQKLAAQSRQFEPELLRAIYHKLAEYDQQIKIGKIQPDLAMDLVVSAVSA
jgi:DNA polymerase-3 subunit delta